MRLPAEISSVSPFIFYIIFLWSIFWKGIALWKAAKYDQRNWFIILLILNTLGVVELIYLFYFSKKRLVFTLLMAEIKNLFSKK